MNIFGTMFDEYSAKFNKYDVIRVQKLIGIVDKSENYNCLK